MHRCLKIIVAKQYRKQKAEAESMESLFERKKLPHRFLIIS